jgi:mannose-6-phosphate isomerase-like protein (cupin superfamily)
MVEIENSYSYSAELGCSADEFSPDILDHLVGAHESRVGNLEAEAAIAVLRGNEHNGSPITEEPMHTRLLALTFLAALAVPAIAQAAEPAPMRTFMNNKEIMGLIDKAKADRKGDAPLVAEPILLMAPYRAQLEYRPSTAPAALHEKDAELMVVLRGAGNIVTGGKLVDEKRINANNLSGSSIAGGNSQAVVVGDMLIVPANTPHQVIPTGGAPIVLMTLHVPHPPMNWPPAN